MTTDTEILLAGLGRFPYRPVRVAVVYRRPFSQRKSDFGMDAPTMSTSQSSVPVFIGLPCFNRPDGLQNTIDSLRNQTYRHWRLLISDNASTDPRVERIGRNAAEIDSRIEYHRQILNHGPTANFRFLAESADAPLMMWASDDDWWHPDFIAHNVSLLEQHPNHQAAFGRVEIINQFGATIFTHPSFERLHGGEDMNRNVRNYLEEPEKLGKANLYYSLFRTEALRSTMAECWDVAHAEFYGSDYVFLFAFFCRHKMAIHDRVHLHKRQPVSKRAKWFWRHPRSYRVTKSRYLESYIQRCRDVAPSPDIADLAERVLRRRQAERYAYLLPPLGKRLERRRLASLDESKAA